MSSIITAHNTHARAMEVKSKVCFDKSQILRIKSIHYLKEAGEALLAVRSLLKPASRKAPVEGYVSFADFLKKNDWNRDTAYRYIKLAENWDVVLKLDMQNVSEKTLANSMRICKTLEIIDWYKKKIKAGADASTLTLKLYWLEQKGGKEKKASQPYDELRRERDLYLEERDYYREQYEFEKERRELLEEQLLEAIK
jgi:hypothetical protein